MKTRLLLFTLLLLSATSVFGQKIAKPTLVPKEDTPAQRAIILEGVKKHDQKQYDDAIALYQQVLNENPDSTLALYEMCFAQYSKGDKDKALETALRGSKYNSSQLPLFYMTIASVIDDKGKPDDAVQLYKDALSILKSEKGFEKQLASIHYNLGVTLVRQKKYTEARETLKKAVEHNFSYSSPHYLLAVVYNGTKYKVPAFMAAARLITLEMSTARTAPSAAIIRTVLEPASRDANTGNISITLDMNAPKDEGDFTMYDMLLGTLTMVKGEKDPKKSPEEIFADAVDSTIALLAEDKKLRSSFVGKMYVPFLSAMKEQGHSKAFAYLVLYRSGNEGALKWLTDNPAKLESLAAWAKAYQPASK